MNHGGTARTSTSSEASSSTSGNTASSSSIGTLGVVASVALGLAVAGAAAFALWKLVQPLPAPANVRELRPTVAA